MSLKLNSIRTSDVEKDIDSSKYLPDYEAVDVLWVALVKMANTMPGANEHKRMMSLVQTISDQGLKACLYSSATERLLNLEPQLESVLSETAERLDPAATEEAMQTIKDCRERRPQNAMVSLGEILKRIRNKRAHGFKTRSDPRDAEILQATRVILDSICRIILEGLIKAQNEH
jgi:hypothetical protein